LSLDLAYDEGQLAIGDALEQFCADRADDEAVKAAAGSFPEAMWRELAELGVLAAATPEGEGGALEVCAAMEALGRAVFPGPLAATFLAGQVLDAPDRSAVVDGSALISAGQPPLMPWARHARIFLVIDGETVRRAEPMGPVEPVSTLGGEPWGRVELAPGPVLEGAQRGLVLSECALAAYLAAAGLRLIADASEHARVRQQFGKPIGEFQGVALPLAASHIRLEAAATIAREAAWRFDAAELVRARTTAARARLSAGAAALDAAYVAHQVFGAIGITLEGPAYHITRRIRQLASQPPGEDAARECVLEDLGLGAVTSTGAPSSKGVRA
jgi:alkylation response protein AidB-like acyl-CoA dehydrogenase